MTKIILLPSYIPDCSGDYASIVLADSPMGYWKLDDSGATAVDSSGNGRDGTYTLTCATQQFTPGPFPCSPSSLAFDAICGSGNTVIISDVAFDSVIGAPNQSWTYEIWMWDNSATALQALIDKTDVSGPADWNLMQILVGGLVNIQTYDGSNNPSKTSTSNVVDSQWHHVVAVRATVAGGDGADELRLYVDGNLQGAATPASGAIDTSNTIDLAIGSRQAGTDRFAQTRYAHVAVYNTALPTARVQAHWNSGWV